MNYKLKVKAKSLWDMRERQEMRLAYEWAGKELGIDIHSEHAKCVLILDGAEWCSGWTILTKNFKFVVAVSGWTDEWEDVLETLFHEMTHLRQYLTGDLVDVKADVCEWKGKEYSGDWSEAHESNSEYWNAPWEVEAREKGAKLLKKWKKLTSNA